MNIRDTRRIAVLDKLKEKSMKQGKAAELLGITVRQVRRLLSRYKKEGAAGASVLTEVEREYPIRGGHGVVEKLISIAALPDDYPTEESSYSLADALRHASHFTGSNDVAVYSLGRVFGHDGKGTIFIPKEYFDMIKNIYLKITNN